MIERGAYILNIKTSERAQFIFDSIIKNADSYVVHREDGDIVSWDRVDCVVEGNIEKITKELDCI